VQFPLSAPAPRAAHPRVCRTGCVAGPGGTCVEVSAPRRMRGQAVRLPAFVSAGRCLVNRLDWSGRYEAGVGMYGVIPAAESVHEALAATVAAGTVRIRLRSTLTWTRPGRPPRSPLWRVLRTLWHKAAGDSVEGLGVLDLRQRRYAIDWGNYSVIYENGRQWGGRPGRLRSRSSSEARPTPLWLIDMLHGAVGGSDLEPIPPTDSDGIHRPRTPNPDRRGLRAGGGQVSKPLCAATDSRF
jgi:hypothetical protein